MPGKSPKLYDLKKTSFWFFLAAIVLFVSLGAMILQDSFREWKVWQRKFMDYKKEKVMAELEQTRRSLDQEKKEELEKQLIEAQKNIDAKRDQIVAVRNELEEKRLKYTVVNMRFQTLKQYQDADRYAYEEALAHGHEEKAEQFEQALGARKIDLTEVKRELESAEAAIEEREAFLDNILAEKEELERELLRLSQEVERLEQQVDQLSPGIAQKILDAPMLDFIQPSLQIQQVVLENIHDDYYFQKVPKVDRCITCHIAIDQKGFEDAPQPFRSHPDLDLYLSAESAHPLEEIGCTVCHGGSGHSVSFTTAAHTPSNATEAAEWKKKYDWHPMKHWAEKMLPLEHVEASCAKCHNQEVKIPGADRLNQGRELAQTFGCYGCHKVEGMMHGDWKVGPDLMHIQSKLESDWIVRWLHNPREFRPSTKMPRIFHLSNTSDPESVEKSNAVIAGIAAYLMKNSEPVALEPAPVEGIVAEGEKLFKAIGCTGCHTKGDIKGGTHGPELTGLGSKVTEDWLFTWLKNPQHYSETTQMPDLRLSDQEAAHLTAFLLADRNEKFESITPPPVQADVVNDLAVTFMTGRMRYKDAVKELENMSLESKLEYIGEKSIAHQGCFGCHNIKGFEDARNIGTELTEEGSKEIKKLDYGFVDIPHTRHDWFHSKLLNPRVFDKNRVKPYHEKLRMPQFDFTEEQVQALTTFLLSLQEADIPMEMQHTLTIPEQQIEAGRLIVDKFNCTGCHTVDGEEGLLRQLAEEPGNAPPTLEGEGRKVQARWLYQFLKHPEVIRPWLEYRMPTFPFTEEELAGMVKYFQELHDAPAEFLATVPKPSEAELEAGKTLFTSFQCIKCHQSDPDPMLSASFLAPDLVMSRDRLRPEWVIEWMKDPQALQEGTMMPNFFPEGQTPFPDMMEGDADKQIHALRDYLWQFDREEARSLTQEKTAPAA